MAVPIKETLYHFDEKNICLDCGQEYERGIMNWARHNDTCPKNAPNENIESYRIAKSWEDKRKKDEQDFKPIYKKMSEEEKGTLHRLMYCGTPMPQENGEMVILHGSASFNRYTDYRNKMIEKYSHT